MWHGRAMANWVWAWSNRSLTIVSKYAVHVLFLTRQPAPEIAHDMVFATCNNFFLETSCTKKNQSMWHGLYYKRTFPVREIRNPRQIQGEGRRAQINKLNPQAAPGKKGGRELHPCTIPRICSWNVSVVTVINKFSKFSDWHTWYFQMYQNSGNPCNKITAGPWPTSTKCIVIPVYNKKKNDAHNIILIFMMDCIVLYSGWEILPCKDKAMGN